MDPAEHNWHACTIPTAPGDVTFDWPCPVCGQLWIWRRPPRPIAQWIRREGEQR